MNSHYVHLNNYLKQVEKDIKRAEKLRRRKAAVHVSKVLRRKLSNRKVSAPGEPPGQDSGNLKKSVGYFVGKIFAIAGFKVRKGGAHAHLLEFGTNERFHKDGKYAGRVEPRPSVGPTFREEAATVKAILSDRWL